MVSCVPHGIGSSYVLARPTRRECFISPYMYLYVKSVVSHNRLCTKGVMSRVRETKGWARVAVLPVRCECQGHIQCQAASSHQLGFFYPTCSSHLGQTYGTASMPGQLILFAHDGLPARVATVNDNVGAGGVGAGVGKEIDVGALELLCQAVAVHLEARIASARGFQRGGGHLQGSWSATGPASPCR